MGFKEDKYYSDLFLEEIKAILGRVFIGTAPFEKDVSENTDLLVLKALGGTFACRIRKNRFSGPFGDQFTLRYKRASGAATEYDKMMQGFGDFMFYGFADERDEHIANWTVIDLNVVRAKQVWRQEQGYPLGDVQVNDDESSAFLAIRIADSMVTARGHGVMGKITRGNNDEDD